MIPRGVGRTIGPWETPVPHLVNLDALFKREDFEAKSDPLQQPSQLGLTLKITELEGTSLTYLTLRKPDFQRETASWEPQKVADLIRCFLDGDLIPSIILWRSQDTGNIFVIDGAHRLGALIAWVHDDYGDGRISRHFFENRMPAEQLEAADKTRTTIKKTIGTYEEMNQALKNPSNSPDSMVRRARNLSAFAVPLQWVIGDATKAEASFFKINQLAAPINETELTILESRSRPNALAARAIIRAGTGHKYWSKFDEERRTEIEKLAKEINASLFIPPLKTPIKTLDLPVAGRVYSAPALPLLFDLVNIANEVPLEKKKRGRKKAAGAATPKVADALADTDGATTIEFLKKTKALAYRISSMYASSLGLHPAVYFYSATGRHQPTSFLAVVRLMMEFDKRDHFVTFTKYRRRFEDFLIKYKDFPNQVVVNSGSGLKGYVKLEQLFSEILSQIENGKDEAGILEGLSTDKRFEFLRVTPPTLATRRKGFSTDVKSAVFLKDALENAVRCRICDCHVHPNAMHIDHVEAQREGGTGSLSNAQLAHPYCDSTYKDLEAKSAGSVS
jgi:Protein of unknown function DUF262/HNH endonuclease